MVAGGTYVGHIQENKNMEFWKNLTILVQRLIQENKKINKPAFSTLFTALVMAGYQLSLLLLLEDQFCRNTSPIRRTNEESRQSSSRGRPHKWQHRGRFRGPKTADVLGLRWNGQSTVCTYFRQSRLLFGGRHPPDAWQQESCYGYHPWTARHCTKRYPELALRKMFVWKKKGVGTLTLDQVTKSLVASPRLTSRGCSMTSSGISRLFASGQRHFIRINLWMEAEKTYIQSVPSKACNLRYHGAEQCRIRDRVLLLKHGPKLVGSRFGRKNPSSQWNGVVLQGTL